jgi:pimeloyl-ACP methyl ester carboxylesterase
MRCALLYLRGEDDPGTIESYVSGLRRADVRELEQGSVEGAGHFTPEENPEGTWGQIAGFIGLPGLA